MLSSAAIKQTRWSTDVLVIWLCPRLEADQLTAGTKPRSNLDVTSRKHTNSRLNSLMLLQSSVFLEQSFLTVQDYTVIWCFRYLCLYKWWCVLCHYLHPNPCPVDLHKAARCVCKEVYYTQAKAQCLLRPHSFTSSSLFPVLQHFSAVIIKRLIDTASCLWLHIAFILRLNHLNTWPNLQMCNRLVGVLVISERTEIFAALGHNFVP